MLRRDALARAGEQLLAVAAMTVRAFPVGVPSLALLPSTTTTSPIFSVVRFQPCRIRTLGLPISMAQFVTAFVCSSATSM